MEPPSKSAVTSTYFSSRPVIRTGPQTSPQRTFCSPCRKPGVCVLVTSRVHGELKFGARVKPQRASLRAGCVWTGQEIKGLQKTQGTQSMRSRIPSAAGAAAVLLIQHTETSFHWCKYLTLEELQRRNGAQRCPKLDGFGLCVHLALTRSSAKRRQLARIPPGQDCRDSPRLCGQSWT